MKMSKDYQAKVTDIVQQIHTLFGDKSVAKRTTLAAMEEIANAAQDNIDALEDDTDLIEEDKDE